MADPAETGGRQPRQNIAGGSLGCLLITGVVGLFAGSIITSLNAERAGWDSAAALISGALWLTGAAFYLAGAVALIVLPFAALYWLWRKIRG